MESASMFADVLYYFTLIIVSSLRMGQIGGEFSSIVSVRTLILVLLFAGRA